MRDLKKDLENRRIDYDKLLAYGFKRIDDNYLYECLICDNKLKVIIDFSNNKQISKVVDRETNEEYVLVDVKNTSGDFVGKVRDEYERVLDDIFKKCTTLDVFKNKQAKEVINYIKDKYDDELEFLWVKFSNNAVWRNKKNNKWYGALLVISEDKLGIDSNKRIEIIDLRYQKDKIKDIIDNKRIYPGYHMNKDNWITIILDGRLDIKEIYKFIDNSYELSIDK